MMKARIVVFVVVAMAAVGCGGPQVARNPGARQMVESTPDKKPDWVNWSVTAKEDKDKFQFIGTAKDRGDFAMAVQEAGIEATKIAGYQLARELNMRLQQSRSGQNVEGGLGEHVRDLFDQEVRGLSIMGLVQKERFVQKYAVGTVSGQTYTYDAFALLEISKADYLTSRQALLDRAAGRARETRNTKAEKLLEEFRAEIRAAPETARQP